MFVWLALVGFLLSCAAADDGPGSIDTSDKASGVTCGVRKCLTKSTCTSQGICQCPEGTSGDGGFACYPTGSMHAEISGPQLQLTTFSNISARILWPCRFRLAEFTSARESNGEKCHFQVFGLNRVMRGRITITGAEVFLVVSNNSRVTRRIGIRREGKLERGVYKYETSGKNEFVVEDPVTNVDIEYSGSADGSGSGDGLVTDDEDSDEWGAVEDTEIGGGQSLTYDVDEDNFATVFVPACGTYVKIRAPNVESSQELQTSGFSLAIDDASGQTSFSNSFTYLAESPTDSSLSSNAKRKNLRPELELLHRVMQYSAKQYNTREGYQCDDAAFTYRSYCINTPKQVRALNECSFFLENASLVSCMDSKQDDLSSKSLNAFKLCLWNSCKPNQSTCNLLLSRVRLAGCTSFLPARFAGGDCSL